MDLKLNNINNETVARYREQLHEKFPNLVPLFSDVEDYCLYNKHSIDWFCKICGEFSQKSYKNTYDKGCWRCLNVGESKYDNYKDAMNEVTSGLEDYFKNQTIGLNSRYEIVGIDFVANHKLISHPNMSDYGAIRYLCVRWHHPIGYYKLRLKCNEHNQEWSCYPWMFFAGKSVCPSCSGSMGENKIITFLTAHNICYKKEFTFPDLSNIKKLRFDFAIFNNNKEIKNKINPKLLIEFNGRQHYDPIEYFGGEETFKLNQLRDNLKRDYCKQNNIKLLEIPYWEFKNVEKILKDELNVN